MAAPVYASALWTFEDVHDLSYFPRTRDYHNPIGAQVTPFGPSTGGPHYAWCYAYRRSSSGWKNFNYTAPIASTGAAAMHFTGNHEGNKGIAYSFLSFPYFEKTYNPTPAPFQSPFGLVQEDFDDAYTLGCWISADPCEHYKSFYVPGSNWLASDPMVIMSTANYTGYVGDGNAADNSTWDWYRDKDGWFFWDLESTGQLSLQQRFYHTPSLHGGTDPNTYLKTEFIETVDSVVSPNSPTHVALRYVNGSVDMFVNGVKVAVTKASDDPNSGKMALTNADTLGIAHSYLHFALGGGTPDKHHWSLTGDMDEAFAVGQNITDARIMDIYLNGFPEPTTVALLLLGAPMIARWRRRK